MEAHFWAPCNACTTLILVSRKRFKQFAKHDSSWKSKLLLVMGFPALHFLKHMSVKVWMDIWTFDLEFSVSMNCMISLREASSRFCKAVCEIVDIVTQSWLGVEWLAIFFCRFRAIMECI